MAEITYAEAVKVLTEVFRQAVVDATYGRTRTNHGHVRVPTLLDQLEARWWLREDGVRLLELAGVDVDAYREKILTPPQPSPFSMVLKMEREP